MNNQDASWKTLFDRLSTEVAARFINAPSRYETLNEFECALLWGEAKRRLDALAAHVLRDLSDDDRADVVAEVVGNLQRLDLVRRVAAAAYPRAYCVRMLRNEAINQARVRASEVPVSDEELEVAVNARGRSDDMDLSTEETQRLLDRLDHQVDQLSNEERNLIHARFWLGRSILELAEEAGVPYSTMASRNFRLIAKLRAILDGESA